MAAAGSGGGGPPAGIVDMAHVLSMACSTKLLAGERLVFSVDLLKLRKGKQLVQRTLVVTESCVMDVQLKGGAQFKIVHKVTKRALKPDPATARAPHRTAASMPSPLGFARGYC